MRKALNNVIESISKSKMSEIRKVCISGGLIEEIIEGEMREGMRESTLFCIGGSVCFLKCEGGDRWREVYFWCFQDITYPNT